MPLHSINFLDNLIRIVVVFLLQLVIMSCSNNRTQLARDKSERILDEIASGTAIDEFPEKYFPRKQTVFLMKQLEDYCDFKSRKGVFINDFYQKDLLDVDKISFIYEYHLKCDNGRFILSFKLNKDIELYKFDIESVKKYNKMILRPEREIH